uniref:Uncharacterized protein n=1 Tax=Rhizophora mucronata TaxID=61149 RepID=A0A2P2NUT5_RHIMU
MLHKQPSSA